MSAHVQREPATAAGRVLLDMVAAFDTGDIDGVAGFVDDDDVDHQGLGRGPTYGGAGFIAVVRTARAAYSTLRVAVEDLIEAEDRAAARLRWEGVRTTGAPMTRESIEVVRVHAGRAVEHWGGRC